MVESSTQRLQSAADDNHHQVMDVEAQFEVRLGARLLVRVPSWKGICMHAASYHGGSCICMHGPSWSRLLPLAELTWVFLLPNPFVCRASC